MSGMIAMLRFGMGVSGGGQWWRALRMAPSVSPARDQVRAVRVKPSRETV